MSSDAALKQSTKRKLKESVQNGCHKWLERQRQDGFSSEVNKVMIYDGAAGIVPASMMVLATESWINAE